MSVCFWPRGPQHWRKSSPLFTKGVGPGEACSSAGHSGNLTKRSHNFIGSRRRAPVLALPNTPAEGGPDRDSHPKGPTSERFENEELWPVIVVKTYPHLRDSP